jgi:Phosphoribulokinase / Uridine kinase family
LQYYSPALQIPAHEALPCVDMADSLSTRAHYSPPWADVSIIGIAGSSGSGKSTLSHAIVAELNLPWVVILSMVSSLPLPLPPALKVMNRTHSTKPWTRKDQSEHSIMNTILILQML